MKTEVTFLATRLTIFLQNKIFFTLTLVTTRNIVTYVVTGFLFFAFVHVLFAVTSRVSFGASTYFMSDTGAAIFTSFRAVSWIKKAIVKNKIFSFFLLQGFHNRDTGCWNLQKKKKQLLLIPDIKDKISTNDLMRKNIHCLIKLNAFFDIHFSYLITPETSSFHNKIWLLGIYD